MKPASKRCIFLTGAPENSTLNWNNAGSLLSGYDDPVRRFVEGGKKLPVSFDASMLSFRHVKWRALPFNGPRATALSAANVDDATRATSRKDKDRQLELVDEDFLDHSIALLENLDSSQIIPTLPAVTDTTDIDISFTTHSTDISFGTTNVDSTAFLSQQPQIFNTITMTGPIIDLKHLPTAQRLTALYPQTQTVNLTAGIITVSPPQRSHSRKPRGKDRDLISLIVGDDTRAGFKINFWLSAAEISHQREQDGVDPDVSLRSTLLGLRASDIVMLSNVALSSWNGSVYGQNLSRRFARNSTELVVLSDGQWDSAHMGANAPIVAKLRRVREWVSDFVGIKGRGERDEADNSGGRDRAATKRKREALLPPDTQD